jgi:hypothetical protein
MKDMVLYTNEVQIVIYHNSMYKNSLLEGIGNGIKKNHITPVY